MDEKKIEIAFELFDNYNSKDPKQYSFNGEVYPQELFFALQVHNWIKKLDPNASEPLLLASRCQHLGRWEVPRETYPDGKAGYLNWRSNLAKYHAEKASQILSQIGYDTDTINKVQHIVLKQQLKSDQDVQTMENALCLVFLEFELEDFMAKHDDAKLIRILQKSWGKMSEPGRAAALTLNYSEKGSELIKKALA
ncbi:DUF4202 domain-containing protein [Pedobacter sp. P351]|uniref:DUF4202 domain-containing protein n=1 Tax=Pedobacter superstes TaxID=3133441 RepID=UPI003096CA53